MNLNFTNTQKGAFLIFAGAILLLYIMGFFKDALHYIILISSLFLIGYGIILGDFWSKTTLIIKNLRHKK